MAIGNGAVDFPNNYKTMVPLYYYHGLVRDELYNRLATTCCSSHIESCDIFSLFFNTTCRPILDEVFEATNYVDPYNLYETCYVDASSNSSVSKEAFIKNALRRAVGIPTASNAAESLPLCAQPDNTGTYLNRADVRAAIHIPTSVPNWSECSNLNYTTTYFNVTAQVEAISQSGVRVGFIRKENEDEQKERTVLIYNGDVDTVCNHVMNMQFLTNLNVAIRGKERVNEPWLYVGDTQATAGFQLKYEGNIDFLTVRGSGHMVPQDKPREAQQMIYNFVHQKDYSSPMPKH